MPTAMEDFENRVNDLIIRLRDTLAQRDDPAMVPNHPKLNELAQRLHVQVTHFRREMVGAGDPEFRDDAPDAEPADPVLPGPYVGKEPRFPVMLPDGRPDPIARAASAPASKDAEETASKASPEPDAKAKK